MPKRWLITTCTRPAPTVWGEKLPFNTVCGEYGSPSGGWVHSAGFSPSGDVLAFVSKCNTQDVLYNTDSKSLGHDSSVSIVYPGGPTIQTIKINSLPFISLAWTAENAIVVAGHDCEPIVFSGSGPGNWAAVGSLDDPGAGKSAGGATARQGAVGRLNSAAFNTFRNASERGQQSLGLPGAGQGSGDTELMTVHQNTITSVRPYKGGPGAVSHVSTSGVDGKLVVWDVSNVSQASGLAAKLAGLQLR
jgi:actin related protein 2/3 complex subunit 1A/1B